MTFQIGREVLRVLKILQAHPEGLRAKEIAEKLALPSRLVRRSLTLLEEEGFVTLDPLSRRHLLRYPHPFLSLPEPPDDPLFYQDLTERAFWRTGFRAYALTVRPWGLHLEATSGNRGQQLWPFGEGESITPHAHASAEGRAILAYLREEALRAHLHRFPPRPLTSYTPQSVAEVLSRLEEARRLGFARARGEVIPERCGLAVPLRTGTGEAFGALGLSLPLGRTCALEEPANARACRRCLDLVPILKEVVGEVWPFSEA